MNRSLHTEERILKFSNAAGKSFAELMGREAHFPCGGKGVCGACKARILRGEALFKGAPHKGGEDILLCQSKALTDEMELLRQAPQTPRISALAEFECLAKPSLTRAAGLSAAFDIGTTTLALAIFDLQSGAILSLKSHPNPQMTRGADLLSRIAYGLADFKNLEELQACVRGALTDMLKEAALEAGASTIQTLTVAGNTAMLHIFWGAPLKGLAAYPFKPEFLDAKEAGKTFFGGVCVHKTISLPCLGAYVGADIASACACADFFNAQGASLLIDIGTNAEIAVKKGGRYFATSAAAGPAFEGAFLSCGRPAENGAICKVFEEGLSLRFETIGNAPASGICGSGYADLLASLRRMGILTENGRLNPAHPRVKKIGIDKAFNLAPNVFMTERDIAELCKAKASVFAAAQILMRKLNLKPADFDFVYIAGGFGQNLNLANAKAINLLPDFDAVKTRFIGNASLGGAYLCGLDGGALSALADAAKKFENIELNLEADFEDAFIDALCLP